MTVRGVVAGALVALCAVALAGCAGGPVGGGEVPASGPLAVYPRPSAGMDALLIGEVALVDGCVVVRNADATALPVFPAGDAAWRDGDTLVWRDDEYQVGDEISLGGGFSAGAIGDAYIPEGCEAIEAFAVSPF
ncbi:dihydrolipoamide dehydrogenase [Microbacterium aureliae]